MTYFQTPWLPEQDARLGDEEILPTPENLTISQFCQFVDYYIRHAKDPLTTAAVCEHQAEAIQFSSQEITDTTIQLLMETLLNVINHLEKKWLDEQLYREEIEQAQYTEPVVPCRQQRQEGTLQRLLPMFKLFRRPSHSL